MVCSVLIALIYNMACLVVIAVMACVGCLVASHVSEMNLGLKLRNLSNKELDPEIGIFPLVYSPFYNKSNRDSLRNLRLWPKK